MKWNKTVEYEVDANAVRRILPTMPYYVALGTGNFAGNQSWGYYGDWKCTVIYKDL